MKTILTLLTALTLLLALAACGGQSATPQAPPDLEISLDVGTEPLAVGETTLIISLKDGSGAPVDGATVSVHADMDHEGMVPVSGETNESTDGEYHLPFEWTMGGGWIVTVTASLPDNGGQVEQTFTYFVEAVSSESIINQPVSGHTPGSVSNGTVNGMHVTYAADRDPAVAGDGTVTITLADADGQPITDAAVAIHADMAHHGMLPVTGEGEHTGDGHYLVPVRWTMMGEWEVTVTITLADGSSHEKTFDQYVDLPGR